MAAPAAPPASVRPRVMGIVNVTPDSFSDGGRWAEPAAAVEHGRDLLADGADILDIGGESTRPGATRPLVAEELARVVPVIEQLAGDGAVVSVDTMRAEVARAALDAGAAIVNDVSGGLADPEILDVVAASGATYVAMHWRAHSTRMRDFATYDGPGGVVGACARSWPHGSTRCSPPASRASRWSSTPAWASPRRPRTTGRCWPASTGSGSSGFPVLVGASRKSFLGTLLADADGAAPPGRRAGRPPTPCWSPTWPGTASGAFACTTCAPPATRCASWTRLAQEE